MRKQIRYQFYFQSAANMTFRELDIEAEYIRQEVPAFDLEGDISNMPDVFEVVNITRLYDVMLGIELNLIEIPVDLRRAIVNAGLRVANETVNYEYSEC